MKQCWEDVVNNVLLPLGKTCPRRRYGLGLPPLPPPSSPPLEMWKRSNCDEWRRVAARPAILVREQIYARSLTNGGLVVAED